MILSPGSERALPDPIFMAQRCMVTTAPVAPGVCVARRRSSCGAIHLGPQGVLCVRASHRSSRLEGVELAGRSRAAHSGGPHELLRLEARSCLFFPRCPPRVGTSIAHSPALLPLDYSPYISPSSSRCACRCTHSASIAPEPSSAPIVSLLSSS